MLSALVPLAWYWSRHPSTQAGLLLYMHCACSQRASEMLLHQCAISTHCQSLWLQHCILPYAQGQASLAESSLHSAESGGQVADTGELTSSSASFTVTKVRLQLGPFAAEYSGTDRFCNAVRQSNTDLVVNIGKAER